MHSACIEIFLLGKVGLLARRGGGGEWNNRNEIGFPLFLTRWHLPICMQYAMTISFLIPASTRRFLQYYNCVVCTLVDKYAHGKLKVESWYGNAEWVGSKLSCLYKIRSTTAAAASKPQKKLQLCTQTVDNTLICHHININNTFTDTKAKYLLNGKW